MKWMAILIAVCLTMALVCLPGRQERKCLWRLTVLDHAINCPSWVRMSEQEGTCSNGVWNPGTIRGVTPGKFFSCPITGTNYVVTFRVGTHPFCPVHGHLIEKYGVRHHESWLHPPSVSQNLRDLGVVVCVVVSIVTAIVMIPLAVVRRKRNEAQRSGGEVHS
jgi:hypothetical protein